MSLRPSPSGRGGTHPNANLLNHKGLHTLITMIRWTRETRFAFRFCLLYFALFSLLTQILGGLILYPRWSFPMLGRLWPFEAVTTWFARSVFDISGPLVNTGNSGDTAFFWVQTFWTALAALAGACVWSLRASRREYDTLHKWLRLGVRFALAAQMLHYGMTKVIPTQFPPPSLVTLVKPVGNLSLSELLWASIGASPAYQVFTGAAELAGGLLVLVPQTTLLGAIVCFVDMVNVFALNMTYDFGLKQISFHLLLMSLFLIAPDFRRLSALFGRAQPDSAAWQAPRVSADWVTRRAMAGQLLFGAYLLVMYTNVGMNYWRSYGGGGYPKSPLYGIWDLTELAIDGEVRSPDSTDYDRQWRRVIFDAPDLVVFQRLDDSFAHYGVRFDVDSRSMRLTKGESRRWGAQFSYDRRSPESLVLDGTMDGHRIRVALERVELDTFRLRNGRFRWIRPPDPYAG